MDLLDPTSFCVLAGTDVWIAVRFQRNDAILDQRFGVRNGDAAAVGRGGAAALLHTLAAATGGVSV